jgi:hypothetical protein
MKKLISLKMFQPKPIRLFFMLPLFTVIACSRGNDPVPPPVPFPTPIVQSVADSEYVVTAVENAGWMYHYEYDTANRRYSSSYTTGSSGTVAQQLVHYLYDTQGRIRAEVCDYKSIVYVFNASGVLTTRYHKFASYPTPPYTSSFYTDLSNVDDTWSRDSFTYNSANRLTGIYSLGPANGLNGPAHTVYDYKKVNYVSPGDTLMANFETWESDGVGGMRLSDRVSVSSYSSSRSPANIIYQRTGGCLFTLNNCPSTLPRYFFPDQSLLFLMKSSPSTATFLNMNGAGSGTSSMTYVKDTATALPTKSWPGNSNTDFTYYYYTKVHR